MLTLLIALTFKCLHLLAQKVPVIYCPLLSRTLCFVFLARLFLGARNSDSCCQFHEVCLKQWGKLPSNLTSSFWYPLGDHIPHTLLISISSQGGNHTHACTPTQHNQNSQLGFLTSCPIVPSLCDYLTYAAWVTIKAELITWKFMQISCFLLCSSLYKVYFCQDINTQPKCALFIHVFIQLVSYLVSQVVD